MDLRWPRSRRSGHGPLHAIEALEGQWAGGSSAPWSSPRRAIQPGPGSESAGFRFGALHFVRLGDTTLQQDVRIDRLLHNDIADWGTASHQWNGSQDCPALPVTLTGPGTRSVEIVELTPGGAPAKATFLVEASAPGLQYTVTVAEAEGETNLENNRRTRRWT